MAAAIDPNDVQKRVGTFELEAETLMANPDVVMSIMGTVIVLRCELVFTKNAFVYEAYSPQFDIVKPEQTLPEYDVDYNGDTEEVTWARKG